MPKTLLDILVGAFARLEQRVLWKWEYPELITRVPPNVKTVKWLPQNDILGHPKIRLFVTHAGLLSIQEAIYNGVPLVGLPVFGDQPFNMNKAEKDGHGIRLHWNTLTEQILCTSKFYPTSPDRTKVYLFCFSYFNRSFSS